jgi:hypothetical protein
MNKYQLPNGSYEFKEEYTEDVAELLASTFLHQNDIWKSIELPFSQLREFFLKEINIHMQSQNRLRKLNNRDDIVLNHVKIKAYSDFDCQQPVSWSCYASINRGISAHFIGLKIIPCLIIPTT